MHRRSWLTYISLTLALAFLVGVWLGKPSPAYSASAMGLQEDFIRVAEQVMPSVVSLKAVRVVTVQPWRPPEDFFRGTPFEGTFREGPSQPTRRRQIGQGSGLIHEIVPAGQVVQDIMREAKEVLTGLAQEHLGATAAAGGS